MKRGTVEHPKMNLLARKLNIEHYSAVGILESLWNATARHHPCGAIGKWSDMLIAEAIGWKGDATQLIDALVDSTWLDRVDSPQRLWIHDWMEHADHGVQTWLKRHPACCNKRGHVRTCDNRCEHMSPACARSPLPLAPCPLPNTPQPPKGDSGGDSAPKRETKRQQHAKVVAAAEIPLLLQTPAFISAWETWNRHREDKGKWQTTDSVRLQLKFLLGLGEQRAIKCIEYTIMKGWEGLKEENGTSCKNAANFTPDGKPKLVD